MPAHERARIPSVPTNETLSIFKDVAFSPPLALNAPQPRTAALVTAIASPEPRMTFHTRCPLRRTGERPFNGSVADLPNTYATILSVPVRGGARALALQALAVE